MGKQYGILKRILNNLESSTLPTAEPSDAGKFAKVDETGEYVLGTGGGSSGGGVLVVHRTVTEEGVHLDTTYADIVAAGFCVLDYVSDLGVHKIDPLAFYGYQNSTYIVVFGNTDFSTDSENGYPVWRQTPVL